MIKFLMGVIAAFSSFIGLLGTANSALATPIINQKLAPTTYSSVEQPVNLNVSSSLWQLTNQDAQDIFAHLGCSCAACSQTVEVNA